MSDAQAEKELDLAIQGFLAVWVPRRLYSPEQRAECRAELRWIIELARAGTAPIVEAPHEGPVD